MGIYIIFGVFMLLSWLVSSQLKSKFEKYSRIKLRSGLSGREVAEKMLKDSGIYDVKVVSTAGLLTDHYNPITKTVNLSESVYNGSSAASAAVASHECGHAVQHATAYKFLQMRSALVPIVSVSSNIVQWVLLVGVLLVNVFPPLLLIGIIMFGLTTLFSIITLPVEIDASKRALNWLSTAGITYNEEQAQAKDALKWAALTYIIAALSSLATLLYYVLIFLGNRNDDD